MVCVEEEGRRECVGATLALGKGCHRCVCVCEFPVFAVGLKVQHPSWVYRRGLRGDPWHTGATRLTVPST